MKLCLILILASICRAAEPDWKSIDQHAVEFLQRYIQIETVNPPADTRASSALIKGELEAAGFTVKLYSSGPNGQTNLITRLPGRDRTKKPLLLLNHQDVVPVDRNAWSVDPFAGIIKDGWIWGRGSLDMKGIGTQQITALIALKQSGFVPSRDIVMFSSADEETSGIFGIRWMLANHADEIDAEYVLDEGGTASRDLLGFGKLVFGIAVGEKQMLWLKMRAKGTAAHGSQPIPDNANMILMAAIHKALDIPAAKKQNPVVEQMQQNIGTMAQNKFTSAIRGNTIALTTLRAGVGDPPKANVIPSTSEATLDCRLLPGVNAEEFISEIKARINDPRVTLERLSNVPDAGMSRSDTPLFAAISAAARKHNPGAVVTPMLIPYGTDSVNARNRGMIAYGLNPMVLDAATMATMHSDEERIPIGEFVKGIRIFYDVLRSDF
jgi:acetylornithine deacetylase/succinyl-diaminopimelate desuccinylase-like protein